MTAREQAQQKKQLRLLQEKERSAALRAFERNAVYEKFGSLFAGKLASGGTLLIAGIDEAGRGPLAGPVAAGACILPEDTDILYLNDSKKLSAKKRDALYDVIRKEAYAFHGRKGISGCPRRGCRDDPRSGYSADGYHQRGCQVRFDRGGKHPRESDP